MLSKILSESMFIYMSVFIISIFFTYLAEQSKNKAGVILFSAISILIPVILAGLRAWSVGVDVSVYVIPTVRFSLRSANYVEFFENWWGIREFSSWGVMYFGAKYLGGLNGSFFMIALIIQICVYIGAYRHRKLIPMHRIMICFFVLFYLNSFSEVRQNMATSIVFMGINNLEEGNYKKFMIYAIIASTFHGSAFILSVLLIVLHFLTSSKFSEEYKPLSKLALFMLVLSMLMVRTVVTAFINYLPDRAHYLLSDLQQGEKAMVILMSLIFMMMIIFPNRIKHLMKAYKFHKTNFFVCLIYLSVLQLYNRMMMYSKYVFMILLASSTEFVRERNLKGLIKFFMCIVFLLYWIQQNVTYWGRDISNLPRQLFTYPYISMFERPWNG